MQTDTDYYDGRWNKVSNVRLFFTELNIAFLPKDLIKIPAQIIGSSINQATSTKKIPEI